MQSGTGKQYNVSLSSTWTAGYWNVSVNSTNNATLEWRTFLVIESTPPTYSLNSTNSTLAGTYVMHRLNWTDNSGLSGYIFSFWNGTDGYRTPASVYSKCGENSPFFANNTIDGSLVEMSQWEHVNVQHEHWITYDLNVSANITKIRMYTDDPTGITNPCSINAIYVSDDPNNLGSSLGSCTLSGSGTAWRECDLTTSKSGRYINITLNISDGTNCGQQELLTGFYEFQVYTSGLINDTWVQFPGVPTTQSWSNVTKKINSTVGATIRWRVFANDTSNNWNASEIFSFVTTRPFLEVSLSTPTPNVLTKVVQKSNFEVRSTVTCRNGPCTNVSGVARYNSSSLSTPDTAISTTEGDTPFYIVGKATEAVETGGDVGSYSSIAIDSQGYVHISHLNVTSGYLRYCNNTLGSWTCTDVESTGPIPESSIAIDSNDKVHISHRNSAGTIKYCNNTLGSWTCTGATAIGRYASIAIDSNNKAHISQLVYVASKPVLRYCNNTLGSWTCTDIAGGQGYYSSIAIDSQGYVHISNRNDTSGYLGYCNNTLGTWTCADVDASSLAYTDTSIAIDTNNKVHMSHIAGNYLRYCNNTLGSWTCNNVEGSSGDTSIAIDTNNKPHISHHRSTDNTLRYCYSDDFSTWNCQKVDDTGGSLTFGRSIAIKKGRLSTSSSFSQYAHIVYYSSTPQDLKYAKITHNPLYCGNMNDGDICQLNWTVNATGDIGTFWRIDVNFASSDSSISSNSTDDALIKISSPQLIITLSSPNPSICTLSHPCNWVRYNAYSVRSTVECSDGPCGIVNGTTRYNASSSDPDTLLNSTKLSCGNMNDGDICLLNWTANATGNLGVFWKIDVNVSSSFSNISAIDTNDATVKIALSPNIFINGIALYYYTGERVNGNVTVIPLENPNNKETAIVSNGEWSLDFNLGTENIQHYTVIIDDNQQMGYNEIKTSTSSDTKLNCSTQYISLSGYSVDINSGSPITSGDMKISVLDTDYTNTTTFSGSWSASIHPCLIPGKVYTLQILITDKTGKRGEFLQKYPAK
jgi:hypothetical protein